MPRIELTSEFQHSSSSFYAKIKLPAFLIKASSHSVPFINEKVNVAGFQTHFPPKQPLSCLPLRFRSVASVREGLYNHSVSDMFLLTSMLILREYLIVNIDTP